MIKSALVLNLKKRLSKIKNKIIKIFLALCFYIFNSFITNFPNHKVRLWYLRSILNIKIGKCTSIHMGCFFTGNNIIFGENSVANRNCYFDSRVANIIIGNNVSISPEVYILTMTHIANSKTFEAISKSVILENYVWIGVRAMVMPGVTLGEGAVLGAMSMATKDIEKHTICVGIPAKKIAFRDNKLEYFINYFPYFNTDIC